MRPGLHPWQLTQLYETYCVFSRRPLLLTLVYLRHSQRVSSRHHTFQALRSKKSLSEDVRSGGVAFLDAVLDEVGIDRDGRRWWDKPWSAKSVNGFQLCCGSRWVVA